MKLARPVAAFGALIGFFGLGLQYWLLYADMSAQGASVLEITWRYFVWFTLLTNAFVTLVMARAALKPESLTGLNAPRIELMAVTSILFVCIVYNVLLASRWNPQGWQKAADVIVHDIVPATFALFWLLRPHGSLTWRDAAFAALWPLASNSVRRVWKARERADVGVDLLMPKRLGGLANFGQMGQQRGK